MQEPSGAAGTYRRRAISTALIAAAWILACAKDRGTDPDRPGLRGTIQIVRGNAQLGEASAPLRDTIVVVLLDTAGKPVPGVRTQWTALDGGRIDPLTSESGADGRALAQWTLGPDTTSHTAQVGAEGFEPVALSAIAALPAPPVGQLRLTELSTYDGSNQTVHPDFATAGDDWPAPRRYLAITPYPNSNKFLENPSFYEAFRSVRWSVPPGASNPLDTSTPPSYMSDPDVVFDPVAREFRMYYREVTAENLIWMRRSADAVNWSERVLVTRGLSHEIISPAVVRRSATEWLMLSVNGNVGCPAMTTTVELRRSSDGVNWSRPEQTNLSRPGMFPWHVDMQWMDDLGEYWALFNNKVDTTCSTPSLYLATSKDGMDWTIKPTPVLSRGAIPEFDDIVYRSTFYYNPATGIVTFWYSGARHDGSDYVWRTAVQRRLRSDLLADVSQVPRGAPLRAARRVPPLMISP